MNGADKEHVAAKLAALATIVRHVANEFGERAGETDHFPAEVLYFVDEEMERLRELVEAQPVTDS